MPRILAALALAACATAGPDVVQRQIDAYNAHDLEAFAATYSDDVLITSAKGEVLVLGKEGLRERYGKAFAKFPAQRCTVAERKTDGGAILLHEIITGRPDKGDPWDAGWLRYEVKDGLIKSVQMP
jgi:hypothetical protein